MVNGENAKVQRIDSKSLCAFASLHCGSSAASFLLTVNLFPLLDDFDN